MRRYELRSTGQEPFRPTHRSTEIGPEDADDVFGPNTTLRRSPPPPTDQIQVFIKSNHGHRLTEENDQAQSRDQPDVSTNQNKNHPIRTMADMTIMEARDAQKIPAIPQFVNPPTFDPRKDSTTSFIRAYNRCAIANAWDNGHKITYFETFLDGAANLWYREYQNRHPDSTWDNITEAFHNEFDIPDLQESLKKRVQQRKQNSNESTRNFLYDLRVVYDEYRSPINFLEFRKFFEEGLNENTYYHYYWLTSASEKPEDMEDLKAMAIKIDNAPIRRNQYDEHRTPQASQLPEYPNRRIQDRYPQREYGGYYPPQIRQYTTPSRDTYQPRENRYQQGTTRPPITGHRQWDNREPRTRTTNNRPICQICKKIGHQAPVCRFRMNQHPNDVGRRN